MKNLAAVILAAGQGTRMKSDLPKVLHPIAGKPMVFYLLDAAHVLECDKIILIVGNGGNQVRDTVESKRQVIFAEQREQLGTGHAVLQARPLLRGGAKTVLVLHADMPLLQPATLRRLAELHASSRAAITMLTACADDSMGFGRILRNTQQIITGIVEESDATPDQLKLRELNCGTYCFDGDWLWEHLPQLKRSGKKQEYYLTDLISAAVHERARVESITLSDATEAMGVNTRAHLAQVEKLVRQRINKALMESGVTLIDPATTYVDANVRVGRDTTIEPNTHLKGATRIGARCHIGPNAMIHDSKIGDECHVIASMIEGSVLEERVQVGPFSHLRPESYLARDVHLGNYVEVKNSRLGAETKAGHFSYIGDAEIGARVNIGAGTITVNYDGAQKNKTVIEDDVFIGSDSMLVAPLHIGARARTGAGSVVRKNVLPDTLVVGVPARAIRKLDQQAE